MPLPLLQAWLKHGKKYQAAGRKLAVVVGPGANSGVNTSGMLAAMVKLKALPPATYIGVSVGAYNLAYILAAHNFLGPTIFGRFYCDNRFFNPWRTLLNRPALNLDFVVNTVLENLVPLNYADLKKSTADVKTLSTDANGNPTLLPLTGLSKAQTKRYLFASAAIPLIGRTVNSCSLEEWDGWLVEHHLLTHLKALGYTDVIWMLNRPASTYRKPTLRENLFWKIVDLKLRWASPALANIFHNRLHAGNFLANPPPGINLQIIRAPTRILGNARNPTMLFHALGLAYRSMAESLGHPGLAYPPEWAPWQHHMPH